MCRDELDVLLRHLGVQLEKDDLDSLLLSLDLDGEGEIDFEEFYVCECKCVYSCMNVSSR